VLRTVRFWWNRFGPMFAAEIRKRRIHRRSYSCWRWHLYEGEVLEVFATKRRDRGAALKFLKRAMKRYGRPRSIVTDRLLSYRAAMNVIGNAPPSTLPFITISISTVTSSAATSSSRTAPPRRPCGGSLRAVTAAARAAQFRRSTATCLR